MAFYKVIIRDTTYEFDSLDEAEQFVERLYNSYRITEEEYDNSEYLPAMWG